MSQSPVTIAIAGALGRMGQALSKAADGRSDLIVAARFDRPDATGDGLVSQAQALSAAQAVIDFSVPEASIALAEAAAGRGVALILGTTGLSPDQLRRVDQAASRIAVVRTGNFSLAVNMLLGLVERAARGLPAEFDIEIFEAHHRRKVDAPSGTALMLGEAAARGRGQDLAKVKAAAREGVTGPRAPGEIGFSVMRGGGIIGEHSVVFASDGEVLTLSHGAIDRSLFADGALAAAVWAARQPPGLYDMQDVLGLRD